MAAGGSVYYHSLLCTTTVAAFQFICFTWNSRECVINNLHLEYEGTFVLQHIPEQANILTFTQLIATNVDHTIFAPLAPSITHLIVNDSMHVRNMLVPGNNSIQQLLIFKTRLSEISFAENDVLYQLLIEKAHLHHMPPTLTNLRNLSYIKINHTPLQQLDLGVFCNFRHLQSIDLSHNRIYVVTGQQYPDCSTSLVEIWLANNRLERINSSIFFQFSTLEAITLSNNLIETISGRFKNTPISEFVIHHNLLSTLDLCEWSPMPYITAFYLDSNKLSHVPKCLTRVPNLVMINLEHNQLLNVTIDAFRELKLLRHLRLSWNPIVTFTMHEHSLPPSLMFVDMRHVRLPHRNELQKFIQSGMICT